MSRVRQFIFNNAVGVVALVVALGGTSYAVTAKRFVGRDGQVHACAKNRGGAVRLVRGSGKCRSGEQKVSWSQVGRQGAAGNDGQPGPAGSIQSARAGGDLAGSYPDPTIAPAAAPLTVAANGGGATNPCDNLPTAPTMVFCGTSVAIGRTDRRSRWACRPGATAQAWSTSTARRTTRRRTATARSSSCFPRTFDRPTFSRCRSRRGHRPPGTSRAAREY
jgi:hypothetical protein